MKLRAANIFAGVAVGLVIFIVQPKLLWFQLLAAVVIAALFFNWLEDTIGGPYENFDTIDVSDDGRVVRYGDVIGLFTMKNNFLKYGDSDGVEQSVAMTRPEDLPRGSYKELFILEDPDQPAGPGNNNPLNYNSKILLRSFNGKYAMTTDSNTVKFQDNRDDGRNVYVVEGDSLQSTNVVRYADAIYLKNVNSDSTGVYITAKDDGTVVAAGKTTDSRLTIQDKFGEGLEINWARRGRAAQSSVFSNYYAWYATDGKLMTFNHTNSELNPWWEVTLPKEVYFDRIIIKNRTNVTDDVKMRLSNFTVILKDAYGVELARKLFSTDHPTDEFAWNNVYHIGRVVRVQLNDASPQYLHMGEVQVFGLPVNYSVLLNKPIMADLTTYVNNNSIVLDNSRSKVYEHQELPLSKDNMTIAFWINVDPKTYSTTDSKYKSILIKGTGGPDDKVGVKSPGIWLLPSDPYLRVSTSSSQNNNDGISQSSYKVPLGKPVHLAVTISSGIVAGGSYASWAVGRFRRMNSQDYTSVLFNPVQKRYYVLDGVDISNYTVKFGKVPMVELEDLDNSGFQNLGSYKDSMQYPQVQLYINGRLSDAKSLTGKPVFNTSPLTFNMDKTLFATINELKFANYAMTPYQVHSLATQKTTNLCKNLLTGPVDASSGVIEFSHSELPAYDNDVTLAFWAKCVGGVTSTKTPLVLKGTVDDPELGVYLWETGDHIGVPVRTKKYPVMEGIDRPDYTVTPNTWFHVAVIVGSSTATVYIDGVKNSSSGLTKDVDTAYASLTLGGFKGALQNCKMCNYAVTVDELPMIMGSHPETAMNAKLKSMFEKIGCNGYPYGIDKVPSGAADLKILLANGQDDNVEKSLQTVKDMADKYLAGDKSADNKTASDMCYGDAQLLALAQTLAVQDCPLPATCLPTAPFTCPSVPEVNDFDIRTHKDFYQYVKAGNVLPPPTLNGDSNQFVAVTQLAQDPAVIQDLLQKNPAIVTAVVKDLAANPTLLQGAGDSLTNLQQALSVASGGTTASSGSATVTPDAVKAALTNDPTLAASVLSDVVSNTQNSTLVKTIAASLLSSNNLDLADVVKQIPPQNLAQIVQAAGDGSMTSVVSTLKDDSAVQTLIQNMMDTGKLTPATLTKLVSDSPAFRSVVSSSCLKSDTKIPEGPIQNHPDFIHYIKKTQIPCYNCELSDP